METDDTPPTDPARRPEDRGASVRPVPDEATLAATATPASVRRAPRFAAFVRAGVLLGAVLGWLLAIVFSGTTGEARTAAILLTTLGGAGFGALVAAGLASAADRRSTRAAAGPGRGPGRR